MAETGEEILKRLEEVIGSEEDLPAKVVNKLILTAIVIQAKTANDGREELKNNVEAVRVLLTGNGKPETGVVLRLKTLEDAGQRAGRAVWLLAGALLTSFVTILLKAIGVL